MRIQRLALFVLPVLASTVIGINFFAAGASPKRSAGFVSAPQPADIGGAFQLTTHRGTPFTERDLVGRPFVVFFGFTHCPSVCPTALFELSEILRAIGSAADQLTPLFISVDPERDTPEVLSSYLESFDERIVGLTGTTAQVRAAAEAFRASYQKVPLQDGEYTMDHSAIVYLMNRTGRMTGSLDIHEPIETRKVKVTNLLSK